MDSKWKSQLLKRMNVLPLLYIGIFFEVSVSPPCFAEINYQDMKGVHDLVNPEFEHLSPIYGFTLLGTKTLENMRFYGNYGPKRQGLDCLEKLTRVHELLAKNEDCPQDAISALIQRLFPSQDGVNFVANQINSDPISHLRPETVGKVLGQMARMEDSELESPEKTQEWIANLKDVLYEEMNPQSYYVRLRKNAEVQLKNLIRRPAKKQCDGCQKLQERIATIKIILKSFNPGSEPPALNSPKKGKGKERDFEEIASLLVNALKESRGSSRLYPKHLPEQILLAYFWKKGNEKQDFIRLLKGMAHPHSRAASLLNHSPAILLGILKNEAFLEDDQQQQDFLAQKYTKTDFDLASLLVNLKGDSKKTVQRVVADFLDHPEKLVFYSHQDNLTNKSLAPILSYGVAKHSSLGGGGYADCGETSLRNFLNIVVYDPISEKFNARYLAQRQDKNPDQQINPNLILFYQKHSDPAASVNQAVRDEWSETITSRHEGVNYIKPAVTPQCEISSEGSGIDNMMVVLDRLLNLPQVKKRSEHLDELCKTLSRHDFELSWNLRGLPNKDQSNNLINEMKYADIEFSINGKSSFIWQFKKGHFVIQEIYGSRESWKDQLAQEVSKRISRETSRETSRSNTQFSPLLLYWFATEKNWDQLEVNSKLIKTNLIYSLPLSSNEVKLFAFQKIVQNHLDTLYPIAKRLQAQLPMDDSYTQKRLSATLADFDYPWGYPPHAIDQPEIKYTRISNDPQWRAALIAHHGKFFENAWMDPRGVIWGDVIRNEDGSIRKMSFKDAELYCNATGAHLPTEKEFDALIKDMGGRVLMGYIPQFLPHLYENIFWASFSYPNVVDFGHVFNGTHGVLILDGRVDDEAARCVVLSAVGVRRPR